MSGIQDLIQHALDQDYNKASEVFGNIMTLKMNDIMDQEKIKIASQIYNGAEEVEASDEDDYDLDTEEEIIEPDEEDKEDIQAIDNMSDEELEDAAVESDYDDDDDGIPTEDELEK